jgi:hypothetical protein
MVVDLPRDETSSGSVVDSCGCDQNGGLTCSPILARELGNDAVAS